MPSGYVPRLNTRRLDFVFELQHKRARSLHGLLSMRMAKCVFLTMFELVLVGRD